MLKLSQGWPLNVDPATHPLTEKKRMSVFAFEALDRHVRIVTLCVNNDKHENAVDSNQVHARVHGLAVNHELHARRTTDWSLADLFSPQQGALVKVLLPQPRCASCDALVSPAGSPQNAFVKTFLRPLG
ncbi:hypothetical protein [Propionivibrio sp.]|uniref:hypothetical protein n=1 Tax=Propionivibrio sp. TaxID=2212460 RepID=UPI0025EA5182|nr:hypothetical protein [Propionivibrio sp.]